MDQVFAFQKNYETRLEEYERVFTASSVVPYTKLDDFWSFYLELTLDPSGWQAVWKIPRVKCEALKVPFPTIVLVYVLDVDLEALLAHIKVLAVQGDLEMPLMHYVPLTQLWPTKRQDKTIVLNMESTANVLDMYRFFYIYLVMPWDEDEESQDWKRDHLVSRLQFYYNRINGTIPKETAEHIATLLNEARVLNDKRHALIDKCDSMDSDCEENDDTKQLIKINVRLIELQNEVNLLENDMSRKVILEREAEQIGQSSTDQNSQIWMVCNNILARDFAQLLSAIEDCYPNEPLSFDSNLTARLASASAGTTILLGPMQHRIKSRCPLLKDLTLKGIGEREHVKLSSAADEVLLDFVDGSSVIENVVIECKKGQSAIQIRKGHVTIKNCTIIGDSTVSITQGIVVLSFGTVAVVSCDIIGFVEGIDGDSDAKIEVIDSTFRNNRVAIKISDTTETVLSNCDIRDCEEYGVVVNARNASIEGLEGTSFDILNGLSKVKVDRLTKGNNRKGDAIVRAINTDAFEDLFKDPSTLDTSMQ